MRNIFLVLFSCTLFQVVDCGLARAEKKVGTSSVNRNYPGGRDEDNVVVQESLRAPTTNLHRRSLEETVLKNYYKKMEDETEPKKKTK